MWYTYHVSSGRWQSTQRESEQSGEERREAFKVKVFEEFWVRGGYLPTYLLGYPSTALHSCRSCPVTSSFYDNEVKKMDQPAAKRIKVEGSVGTSSSSGQHGHLSFLLHGEGKNSLASSMFGPPVSSSSQSPSVTNKTPIVMQAEIVSYLMNLTSGKQASPVDILRELGIDLVNRHSNVLDLVKCNPKVIYIEGDSSEQIDASAGKQPFYLKYHAKFEVYNKSDLLNLLDRVKAGISRSDLLNCYDGVHGDLDEMMHSGEVIANKNKDKDTKDIILYPRGPLFLTELSGTVQAKQGVDELKTDLDVTNEIRRGDAILVKESWFRIDCHIEGSRSNQPERAKPPLTVSSTASHDPRGRNVYKKVINESTIPLDGEYDGDQFHGKAYKHGCSNDLRELWNKTKEDLEPFKKELDRFDIVMENELIRLKLLTRPGSTSVPKAPRGELKHKRIKKSSGQSKGWSKFSRPSNTHLLGTELGKVLKGNYDTGGR